MFPLPHKLLNTHKNRNTTQQKNHKQQSVRGPLFSRGVFPICLFLFLSSPPQESERSNKGGGEEDLHFIPFPFNPFPLTLFGSIPPPQVGQAGCFAASQCSFGFMENRIAAGSYFQYSPSGVRAPLQRSTSISDRERYLADLLAERRTLAPFMPILPVCSRLLNQEIMRVSGLVSNQLLDHERMGHENPYGSLGQHPNGGAMNVETWNPMGTEENRLLQKLAPFQTSPLDWHSTPGTTTTPIVKRVIRLDVPVDKFPNYNFVGRILGPRGNSLKRVEAMTECRIYIRGQGSVKDSIKEDKLKDKPGYEHLNEPLHILLEAEFPEDMIDSRVDHAVAILEKLLKPVDESMDLYKKQQLRELAMLNGTLREESPIMSPSMSPSMSPFNSTGMKRAKTGR